MNPVSVEPLIIHGETRPVEVPREVVTIGNETTLEDYAKQLNNLQSEIESNNLLSVTHGKRSLELAVKSGEMLIKCRDLLKYGDFVKWLKTEVKSISQATAYRYIKLVE